MRAVVFTLLLASVALAVTPTTYPNTLNASPKTLTTEKNLMADIYSVVVYIGDSYENLPEDLRPIGDAIAAFRQVLYFV